MALEKKVMINEEKLDPLTATKKGLPFLVSLFLFGALGRIDL
jgi:hypothetical protein